MPATFDEIDELVSNLPATDVKLLVEQGTTLSTSGDEKKSHAEASDIV